MPDDVAADHSSAGGLSQGCAAVSHSSGLLGPLDQLHRADSPIASESPETCSAGTTSGAGGRAGVPPTWADRST